MPPFQHLAPAVAESLAWRLIAEWAGQRYDLGRFTLTRWPRPSSVPAGREYSRRRRARRKRR